MSARVQVFGHGAMSDASPECASNRTSSGPDARSQSQLFAFARDIVDATGAAQKFCGFLDRAAGFDRGLKVVGQLVEANIRAGKRESRGAYWRYDRQGADNDSFRLPEMRADLPSYPKAPARWGRTV
jgi:hypothetical protein